ncbi:DUF871 domain-containing protein [Enterococcus sp. 5H]|uniref:DUF871 domain-containing protein n=1 Tax=Enterococcus sp. 5H TaxID=1229490 RepID=UPI00230282B4|nr:MupG family TIM beta-alpha barrel fold protein [Enterococcus sp. 5H]
MYGISVFLGEEITNQTRNYIQKMQQIGFEGIFTSLHIPEDDASLYAERLKELGRIAKVNQMKLMVDISGEALMRAGFSFEDLDEIIAIGVTGLRMDYAISNQKIAEASRIIEIGLNASTITEKDVAELNYYKADFTNFQAWHNYYPRPETGLSSQFFNSKNSWLKEVGFQVFAFIPGNGELRGPLGEGLPTLEKHRYTNPLAAAIELKEDFDIDGIYIGDPRISERTRLQFEEYNHKKLILMEVADVGSDYYELILGDHTNRQDEARDVLRSADARFRDRVTIIPERAQSRNLGSVTVDNELYGRYMGEIQVALKELPADKKVNVAAKIVKDDRSLLNVIKAGSAFKLIEKGNL